MRKSDRSKKRRQRATRALVLAGPRGEIQFADATARRWLQRFFGRAPRPGLLPTKVCRWLREQPQRDSQAGIAAKQPKAQLFVTKQKVSTDETTLLIVELIKGKMQERARRHRDLTPRELEVWDWIARAKSPKEIAQILGIAPATVSKHLERLYPKLGVENRTAAANLHRQDRQSY